MAALFLLIALLGFVGLLIVAAFLPRVAFCMSVPLAATAFSLLGKTEGFLVGIDHFFGGLLLFVTGIMLAVAFGSLAGRRTHPAPPPPPPLPELPRARVISG